MIGISYTNEGMQVPLDSARIAQDGHCFREQLTGDGWHYYWQLTIRCRTEFIVPAPGLLVGA